MTTLRRLPDLDNICAGVLPLLDLGQGPNQIVGGCVGVVTQDGRCGAACDGSTSLQAHAPPRKITCDTWFDLASLTKVMMTTRLILELVVDGAVELDETLSTYIPDLRQYDVSGASERTLTIRQCLSHQTFLPAVVPLYTYASDPETLKAFVLQKAWPEGPHVYSDINFILLGIVIERVTGKPLAEQGFTDDTGIEPDLGNTAATEVCAWRGRLLRGEVHDENAFALGGLAGHAGLFGTLKGVLNYAHTFLQGGPVHRLACQRQSATRTLGWERKYLDWQGGELCSDNTIGHVGFTGTGLWIDVGQGLAWSILTNRVYPSRHRETEMAMKRREVSDAIIRAVQ